MNCYPLSLRARYGLLYWPCTGILDLSALSFAAPPLVLRVCPVHGPDLPSVDPTWGLLVSCTSRTNPSRLPQLHDHPLASNRRFARLQGCFGVAGDVSLGGSGLR